MQNVTNEKAYERQFSDVALLSQRFARYAMIMQCEKATNPTPRNAKDIPVNFEAVAAEWLEAVICSNTPGAKIEKVDFGIGHVGTTGRQQYKITYNSTGQSAGLPSSIFAKGMPTLMNRVAMSLIPSGQSEADFYQIIRPLVDMEAPIGYFSNYDHWTGRGIHLIEDLVETKGARFPEPDEPLMRTHAESLVLNLAKLHGRFFDAPELTDQLKHRPHWTDVCRRTSRIGSIKKYHVKGLHKGRHFLPSSVVDRAVDSWRGVVLASEDHRHRIPTIMHGDTHLRNWYITAHEEMGLLDWQIVTRGFWMRDVAYAIASCLTVEQRRTWEEDLLTIYLADLNARTGQSFTLQAVWNDYMRQIFSALGFWTATYAPPDGTPHDMQPEHVSEEMLKRFCAAIDDHDGFTVFDEMS